MHRNRRCREDESRGPNFLGLRGISGKGERNTTSASELAPVASDAQLSAVSAVSIKTERGSPSTSVLTSCYFTASFLLLCPTRCGPAVSAGVRPGPLSPRGTFPLHRRGRTSDEPSRVSLTVPLRLSSGFHEAIADTPGHERTRHHASLEKRPRQPFPEIPEEPIFCPINTWLVAAPRLPSPWRPSDPALSGIVRPCPSYPE